MSTSKSSPDNLSLVAIFILAITCDGRPFNLYKVKQWGLLSSGVATPAFRKLKARGFVGKSKLQPDRGTLYEITESGRAALTNQLPTLTKRIPVDSSEVLRTAYVALRVSGRDGAAEYLLKVARSRAQYTGPTEVHA